MNEEIAEQIISKSGDEDFRGGKGHLYSTCEETVAIRSCRRQPAVGTADEDAMGRASTLAQD